MAFPILPCDLCGSQENLQRKIVGRMIDGWEKERPGQKAVLLAALSNVVPSHLLDRDLWKTLGLVGNHEVNGDLVPEHRLIASAAASARTNGSTP
jgi:tRNA 2-thiocytidine biosynthesis protein TtcA